MGSVLALAAACRPAANPELPLDRRLPLAPAAAVARTLAIDSAGVTLGVPGALLRLDSTSARVLQRIALPDTAPPLVLGRLHGTFLLRQGHRLLLVGPDSAHPPLEAAMERTDVVALDPWHRFVLRGTASGAALGLDTDSLRARWSWARLGRATTALAFAPEADQAFLALAASEPDEAGPEILARDAQTGRILHQGALPWPARSLLTGRQGRLYAVAAHDGRGAVLGLEVGPGGVRERWRRSFSRLGLASEAHLRLSPEGDRLVVFVPGPHGGIVLLDARTGEPLARGREGPLDAAFDAGGALWLLRPGELSRVREPIGRTPP